MPSPVSVSPVTLLSTFPNRMRAHSFLQMLPALQSRRCNRSCLPLKSLRNLDVSIHLRCIFFYLGFLSRTFTIYRIAGKGGGSFYDSCLPLPPASQTLRHQPSSYCRELTSALSQQSDSNWEPSVSERKLLTTKLRTQTFANRSFCRNNTPQGYFAAKTRIFIYLQNQYLKSTSNVNVSPAQSPNIKILFKCVLSIDQLGLMWWKIGATPILYSINKSSKPLSKINKLTFTKIQC